MSNLLESEKEMKEQTQERYYEFNDSGPDENGRRFFFIYWYQDWPNSMQHVGVEYQGRKVYPRGQAFFCVPESELRTTDIEDLPPWYGYKINIDKKAIVR